MKFDFSHSGAHAASFDTADIDELETLNWAQAKRESLVSVLKRTSSPIWTELGNKMDKCRLGAYCRSAGCPACLWRFRRWWGSQIASYIAKSRSDWLEVRITPADLSYPLLELDRFGFRRAKDRLRKQLDRSIFADAMVVGGIECPLQQFADRAPKWRPRFWLLTNACSSEKIKVALETHYKPDDDTRHPVSVRKVKQTKTEIILASCRTFQHQNMMLSPSVFVAPSNTALKLNDAELAELTYVLDQQGFLGRMFRRGKSKKFPLLTTR